MTYTSTVSDQEVDGLERNSEDTQATVLNIVQATTMRQKSTGRLTTNIEKENLW